MTDGPRFVPPRPNPGPEPFPADPTAWPWVALGVAACLLMALGIRTRRRIKTQKSGDVPVRQDVRKPENELVAIADAVRDALVIRFGPAWRAKTTEEIDGHPTLIDSLGAETAGQLVALLREADRAKFGSIGDGPVQGDAGGWAAWVGPFLAEAGARSKINGK